MNKTNHTFTDVVPRTISWAQAREQGLKQYFTGVPCKHGHVAARDVSDRSCYECKLLKAAAWKKANADKHAEINRRWSAANPQTRRRTQLKQRSKDPKSYWAQSTFQNAKKRALLKGLPFTVTKQDIYEAAGETCPVFGTRFDFVGNGRIVPESPSLDRIVPALGYVHGNVVVISMRANAIKQNATADEIQRVAEWLRSVKDK